MRSRKHYAADLLPIAAPAVRRCQAPGRSAETVVEAKLGLLAQKSETARALYPVRWLRRRPPTEIEGLGQTWMSHYRFRDRTAIRVSGATAICLSHVA
jgi:hypothetical protein